MEHGEIVDQSSVGDVSYRVRLVLDTNPANPRTEYDNFTHALTVSHSNYMDVAGDEGPLAYGWDRLKERHDALEVFTRWARIFHNAWIEHNTPHRGPHSVWYILPSEVTEHEISDPVRALRGEIDEYQAWADGDVYGYIIERLTRWTREDDRNDHMDTWEEVDDGSCWGYVGYKYAHGEAEREFTNYLRSVSK